MYAFLYLNSQLKHDGALEIITGCVASSIYPKFYPYAYGIEPCYQWNDFENHEDDRHNYRKYYDKLLVNNNVLPSIEKLFKIINEIVK